VVADPGLIKVLVTAELWRTAPVTHSSALAILLGRFAGRPDARQPARCGIHGPCRDPRQNACCPPLWGKGAAARVKPIRSAYVMWADTP